MAKDSELGAAAGGLQRAARARTVRSNHDYLERSRINYPGRPKVVATVDTAEALSRRKGGGGVGRSKVVLTC